MSTHYYLLFCLRYFFKRLPKLLVHVHQSIGWAPWSSLGMHNKRKMFLKVTVKEDHNLVFTISLLECARSLLSFL